jgi:hypothetical protein
MIASPVAAEERQTQRACRWSMRPPSVEETRRGRPSLQTVIHGFGERVLGRQSSPLAEPFFEIVDERLRVPAAGGETPIRCEAVALALDNEQGVDALDRLYGDRCLRLRPPDPTVLAGCE